MAFPTVESTATYISAAGDTTHAINLPASIQAGDLLLFFLRGAFNAGTLGAPSGWTRVRQINVDGSYSELHAKIAAGTEGSTVSVTFGASVQATAIAYRISGVDGSTLADVLADSGSTTVTPTALDRPTAWNSADVLWITGLTARDSDSVLSVVAPTNYGTQIDAVKTGSGSDFVRTHSAIREANTATETPDAWGGTYPAGTRPATHLLAVRGTVGGRFGFRITDIKEPNESDALVTGVSTATVLVWVSGDYSAAADQESINQTITSGTMEVEVPTANESDSPIVAAYWDAGAEGIKFFRTTPSIIDLDA